MEAWRLYREQWLAGLSQVADAYLRSPAFLACLRSPAFLTYVQHSLRAMNEAQSTFVKSCESVLRPQSSTPTEPGCQSECEST